MEQQDRTQEDYTIGVILAGSTEQDRSTMDDHTMGVILAVSVIGLVVGLLAACGFASLVGWWFG